MTDPAALDDAVALADRWDAASGVVTRPARVDELAGVVARFDATWGPGRGPDRTLLQALAHAGNTVLVAVEANAADAPPHSDAPPRHADPPESDAPPIGAALGFLGWDGGLHLHSHMNAVDPARRGRGIGIAVKLRQRAICLANGVDEIRWTYDPLIRRNAHLNLVRLGAEVTGYHPDFYGDLRDAISGVDRSDRFEVRWRLDAPRVRRALTGSPAPTWSADPAVGALALVADFEAVRAAGPDVATELRDRSRAAFAEAVRRGLRPELDAAGDYVFTTDDPDREA